MINGQMDEIDIKMHDHRQTYARIDVSKLSQLVYKIESPIRQCLAKLMEAGYIKNCITVLYRGKIGKQVLVVTMIQLERQTNTLLCDFEEIANPMDEVLFCLHLSGKWNFKLHVTAETPQHYYDFLMEKLCDLPKVKQAESSFVLKECKSFRPFKL